MTKNANTDTIMAIKYELSSAFSRCFVTVAKEKHHELCFESYLSFLYSDGGLTDTGVLNKNVVTVETNNRNLSQLVAISVNLKSLINSHINFSRYCVCCSFMPYHFIWLSYLRQSSQFQLWKWKAESSMESCCREADVAFCLSFVSDENIL